MNRDPGRRPIGKKDLADQVLAGDGPPDARVARRGAVVAHEEVAVLRDRLRRLRVVVAPLGLDVRLVQLLPVDVDEAVSLLPAVAREADQALDEPPAAAAGPLRRGRCLEDDDLPSLRVADAGEEAGPQQTVGAAR